jgi:hypothetical protein
MSDLIDRLTADLAPVKPGAARRRIAPALILGATVSLALMLAVFGLRADIASAVAEPGFWMKLGFTLGMAALAGPIACRLAVPARGAGWWPPLCVGLAAILVAAGAMQLAAAEPSARLAIWLGHSWAQCPFNVAALSLPVLAATLFAMRRLAPTNLRAAGLAAGLLSGSAGAAVYALACAETGAAFLATWYLAGIALVAGIGWLTGPTLLRW